MIVYPFNTKAIIEKHIGKMIEEIGETDGHPFGWIGNNVDTYLTELIFNALMLAKDTQDYCEQNEVFNDE